MIWEYLNDISTAYVFGGSRYEPYDTDCSGMVCAGFHQLKGVDPFELGWWTGGMWASPLLEIIWQGKSPELPWNIMKEDDLIFTSTQSPYFDSFDGSHVGLYTGNREMPFLSHFANGGPFITQINGVYGGNERYYGVARLRDGKMEEELEEIKKYMPAWVWEYNWENTAPDGNMYNCVIQMRMMLQDLWQNRNNTINMLEKVLDELKKIQVNEDDGR